MAITINPIFMFQKVNKEKILPPIKLKYRYLTNEKGERPSQPDLSCAICHKKSITVGGSKIIDGKIQVICEDCAIDDYQKFYKFASREAAISSRRRIFDIGYLFNEMLIDKYLAENNLVSIDDLSAEEMEYLVKESICYYDSLFSKRKKIFLEQMEEQTAIEEEFKRVLPKVKLKNLRQSKNISLTVGQYENLVKLVYAGSWLINAIRSGQKGDEVIEKYDDLENYILSFAKDFEAADLADYDKKDGRYYPSTLLEEGEVRAYIEDYDDDCFWEELTERLMERDFLNVYGQEAISKMSLEERFEKQQPLEEKYRKEFEDYGLEHIDINVKTR